MPSVRRLAPVVAALLIVSVFGDHVCAQHDYKVVRRQIRANQFDKAIEIAREMIAKHPEDSEWLYQMAIAHAQKGEQAAAIQALGQALALGTPPGRVAAEAHDLLRPLRGVSEFDAVLAGQHGVPIQGPMLGNVTGTSAQIWLRTAAPASVRVDCRSVADGRAAASATAEATEQSDQTAVVSLTGLEPLQEYEYALTIEGQPVSLSYPTRFRTTAATGSALKFTFAFGGGAGYVTKHERMWDTIAATKPAALLMLGDNMYSDDPESPTMQRFCYYRRQSPPEFRRLVARTAVYSIWDDHDFGTNDCSGGPEIDVPAWKRPVWEVFQQNWVNPAYGGGAVQPGCWYDFRVGDIHFLMLDGRYYRDPKGGSMLGPVQKEWLKRTIAASKATFKVIASPVPWEYRTKGDSKDTWNGFRAERDELFDFFAEQKIEGVVLISADRHRSDAWKIDRPNGYALYEFNSSRLTNNHTHPTMKEALFSYNAKPSFGLVEFDTTADDPQVKYTVISIDGERVHDLTVRHSQLRHTD